VRARPGGERASRSSQRAQSWTAIYTRELLPEVVERRREEVRSDLFEHDVLTGPGPVQHTQLISRVLKP